MFSHPVQKTFFPHNNSGLRASQQFVPAEADHISSGRYRRLHGGLSPKAVPAQIHQHTASQILHHADVSLFSQSTQILQGNGLCKSYNPVIACMHFQKYFCLFINGIFIIRKPGPVGCSHLSESGAALFHYIGNTEFSADLHQLASGYSRLASPGKNGQNQKHGGGVIIHRKSSLCPGNPAEQPLKMGAPFSPFTRVQIQFQVGVCSRDFPAPEACLFSQRRSSQPCMQNDSGTVYHGNHFRPEQLFQPFMYPAGKLLNRLPDYFRPFFFSAPVRQFCCLLPQFLQNLLENSDNSLTSILVCKFLYLFFF